MAKTLTKAQKRNQKIDQMIVDHLAALGPVSKFAIALYLEEQAEGVTVVNADPMMRKSIARLVEAGKVRDGFSGIELKY